MILLLLLLLIAGESYDGDMARDRGPAVKVTVNVQGTRQPNTDAGAGIDDQWAGSVSRAEGYR